MELTDVTFHPDCELACGRKAQFIAQGCMDKQPVLMCEGCLERGIHLVELTIHMYMRLNKRPLVCGDCYRPILNLDTHVSVTKVQQ
jgi:hypothetical protein